mmetsp:Transcript_89150/g.268079  ORF Transcript_89150/g.268079 Transcript_89150/m.268079 type:complete len:227 (-) Transcript_89150:1368-2048(-)
MHLPQVARVAGVEVVVGGTAKEAGGRLARKLELELAVHEVLRIVRQDDHGDPQYQGHRQHPPHGVAPGDGLRDDERHQAQLLQNSGRPVKQPPEDAIARIVLGNTDHGRQLVEVLQVVDQVDHVLLHVQKGAKLLLSIVGPVAFIHYVIERLVRLAGAPQFVDLGGALEIHVLQLAILADNLDADARALDESGVILPIAQQGRHRVRGADCALRGVAPRGQAELRR